ncbi:MULTISPECIES: adenosylcobalamin-dependent ribonucleoside-diphosphate reductase [Metallosphaera]|uniref:Vitamin B12-dependent ribonucleotide reductase n=3 Tax=Metallosphaera TaxID=41980 RepID=A4YHG9_METS5|nr:MULTISPECIES: adenosylcobalamin-dependent ribonucleoside-diphosphate reductase [Metallosphaera]ABP95871.1 ribonucleoside-diphosphate reductase, adenosylcobalamin-dependent [Metallosphaera sedula DSM 5348]AIM27855.1 ribonucleoside-diphosphate reductase, adenosylcobalamin-dependent [Metallosphaera sedula]AKV74700.1 ribonucleoside-diphosphate reductase [Metallosphaera sedula]AKV76938.1 ribonucleoside-diphosphate reductase [Metallosphaera sedula]AKV79189.1 ribonucleoside-diphosphate reductase [
MQSDISILSLSKISVIKRDGRREEFKLEKILSKLGPLHDEIVDGIAKDVIQNSTDNVINTRSLADIVERNLIEGSLEHPELMDLAKKYVLARIYNHVFGKGKWSEFDPKDLLISYNALKVLEARYLLKDPETLRYIETPQMMFKRVASYLAKVEQDKNVQQDAAQKFYEIMSSLKFVPNTPALMNSGTRLGILSACFVLPVRDSMTSPSGDGIYDTLRAMALVHQQGGGTGFDFSELRPKGDVVASTAGVASGPVSFMKIFDVSTDVVKQGGKRRGANMGVMHAWHADIEDFIHAKTGELKDVQLQNFNISVGVYDYFMEAVMKEEQVPLITPRKTKIPGTDHEYYIVKARNYMREEWVQEEILRELEEKGSVYLDESKIITVDEALAIAEKEGAVIRWVNARTLFEQIVKGAWDSGDPGLLFIDEINRRHPTWYLGKIQATNPCGEEPLLPWESCNLGSLNLEKFVKERDGTPYIDWDDLANTIRYAVRFLDNVVDANRYPLPQIEQATKRTRKVGLGVMGLARALIKLGIPYDSVDAVYVSYYLAKFIYYHAMKTSIELAKEKGSFPAYDPVRYKDVWESARELDEILTISGIRGKPSDYAKKLMSEAEKLDVTVLKDMRLKYGLRNATVVSVAPTGTISIIAGTSSSIEPLFALAFIRNVAVGKFMEIDPLFLEYLRKYELDTPDVVKKIAETGEVGDNPFVPKTIRKLFRTAHEVEPMYHVLHQAAWQQWNDSGTSKTINLRSEEPADTVEKVYMTAWKLGIKGITVYRDKSKSQQVIYFGLKKEREEKSKALPSSLRMEKKFVEVSENFAGGCKTCEL